MGARRIISVPVAEDLGDAIRAAAAKEAMTISAWVRERLIDALRAPRAAQATTATAPWPLGAVPRAWTLGEVSALLDISPAMIARKLRAKQIAGYHEHRSFYDPGRGKFLRRTWWMIPGTAIYDYMNQCLLYEAEHGKRRYTRRSTTSGPAGSLVDRTRPA